MDTTKPTACKYNASVYFKHAHFQCLFVQFVTDLCMMNVCWILLILIFADTGYATSGETALLVHANIISSLSMLHWGFRP